MESGSYFQRQAQGFILLLDVFRKISGQNTPERLHKTNNWMNRMATTLELVSEISDFASQFLYRTWTRNYSDTIVVKMDTKQLTSCSSV